MDSEQDLVVFTDEAGEEKTMEVLDYFFYEGQEYAVLTESCEDEACACEECDHDGCEHDHEKMDVYLMQVKPVGDDQEEFVPVDDELMDRLIEFVQNELYADDDEEDDDELDEDPDQGDE